MNKFGSTKEAILQPMYPKHIAAQTAAFCSPEKNTCPPQGRLKGEGDFKSPIFLAKV